MNRLGHLGINALVAAPVVLMSNAVAGLAYSILAAICIIGLCSVPDLDLRDFYPGKHRGFTHTVWFALLIGASFVSFLLFASAGPLSLDSPDLLLFAGSIGVLGIAGHLLGDILTPMGVAPYSPLSDRTYSLSLWNADNPSANLLCFLVGFAALIGAFTLVLAPSPG